MKKYVITALTLLVFQVVWGQTTLPTLNLTVYQPANPLWTEADRQYQLQNLQRAREAVINETLNLSPAQRPFQKSTDRWSIAQVIENLALWEILVARQITVALCSIPALYLNKTSRPDQYYLDLVFAEKQHASPTYSHPSGSETGKNNIIFFLKQRDQTIAFLHTTTADLKAYFEPASEGQFRNVFQVYLLQWGYVDRQLQQIEKKKAHPDFSKSMVSNIVSN